MDREQQVAVETRVVMQVALESKPWQKKYFDKFKWNKSSVAGMDKCTLQAIRISVLVVNFMLLTV